MNTVDLRTSIIKQINAMDKNKLEEVSGILANYFNGEKDIDDWNLLSEKQQSGILDARNEIANGKGISHNSVITKYRQKYNHDNTSNLSSN